MIKERHIKDNLITKLHDMKYTYRKDIRDLLSPLDLGWIAKPKKELALTEDLIPVLNRLAQGREISGLSAYEE